MRCYTNRKRPRLGAVALATDRESVSKRCVFGVAVFSYFALTGGPEGALLRSNVISRRRIMLEDRMP